MTADGSLLRLRELVDDGLTRYQQHCLDRGIDPDLLTATARLAHGWSAARWAAYTLWTAPRTPDPTIVDPGFGSLVAMHQYLARDPRIAALVASENPHALIELAKRTRDIELQRELARHPDDETRAELASNPHLIPILADQLAADPNAVVRHAIASNPHTRSGPLTVLAADPDPVVRGAVAAHGNTPRADLDRLAADPDPGVRASYCRNRRARIAILDHLADDPSMHVRNSVAMAENTANATLLRLCNDPDFEVADWARTKARLRGLQW